MRLLIDSSALYAALDGLDRNHKAANAAFVEAIRRGDDLRTHNYVVSESCALVQRRLGADATADLLRRLIPLTEIVWVDREIHDSAVAAFVAARSTSVSLVDRVSFEVMRREGLETAFAFDAGFVHAGFQTVP